MRLLPLLLAMVLASGAAAQPTWEPLGLGAGTTDLPAQQQARAIAFRPGAAGQPDTLYALNGDRGVPAWTWRYAPDHPDAEYGGWVRVVQYSRSAIESLADGTLLVGSGNRFNRSTDGGRTWSVPRSPPEPNDCGKMENAHEATLPPPIGAEPGGPPKLYVVSGILCVSLDGGASFRRITQNAADYTLCTDGRNGAIVDVAHLPPSASLPNGRLLGAVHNGAVYSDDGRTFECSALWEPFRWWVEHIEVHADPEHAFGGTAYAVMRDFFEGFPAIYASEDGGVTYPERETFLRDTIMRAPQSLAVEVTADGVLVAGIDGIAQEPDGTLVGDRGVVIWSNDGGRTWETLTPEGSGWGGHGVLDIEIGRDGRLYAATARGVWRTADAVPLPVASSALPEASGASLRVSPNPSSGAAQIALSLDTPEAVRVTVYDARGREVWASGDGPARTEHAWAVDTGAWAAGIYVMRAGAGGEMVSARLVVAH